MGKRNQTETPTTKQEVKRVNSKESLLSSIQQDDVVESASEAPAIDKKKFFSNEEIESLLRVKKTQSKCLIAMSKAHCVEALDLLLELFAFEQLKDDIEKENKMKHIISEYVEINSPKEVCFSSTFRKQLLLGEAPIDDIKKLVISDLRFNRVLVETLQAL